MFPLRRVYCVGRNYADHAREMGHDPDREPPFFFQKNPDCVFVGPEFPYPAASSDVHHEIELLVALKSGGRDIAVADAPGHVFGYAVALDMTRRDLQADAKKLARPLETAKAFDRSGPCGPVVPAARIGHPASGAIWLDVNGARRQQGDLKDMIWKVPEMIAFLSRFFELCP
ncbi:MAG: fumarylacetoacetate hydrolase family protein, partial [Rhizobiales bacterium]|nr:fumarylacetoacetate hydrolase family protein [Hyphomicrobiales bacterium]